MKAYIISINGTPIEIELTDEQVKRLNYIARRNAKKQGKRNE